MERRTKLRLDLGCPTSEIDICGRLIVERERYVRLEEELERTKQNLEDYRQLFSILLRQAESRLLAHLIPEVFKHNLSRISQVKAVYCFQRKNTLSFWIFLDEENWDAEDQIYENYGEMLSTFENFDIRMRLLRLWGRKPEDLLPAGRGVKIFGE